MKDILVSAITILIACNLTRLAVDYAAQIRHWRVGPAGRFLSLRRKGSWCLRCKTDWRWAEPHDLPLRADGYSVFPCCGKCWAEMGEPEKLLACGQLLQLRDQEGLYASGLHDWNEDREAIYAAVKAGL